MSDYYDSPGPDVPVTEMTDERLEELGFPVVPSSPASSVLVRPPQDNVINNPFFTFVSRKYRVRSPHGVSSAIPQSSSEA